VITLNEKQKQTFLQLLENNFDFEKKKIPDTILEFDEFVNTEKEKHRMKKRKTNS
jgi:hypothetical protein